MIKEKAISNLENDENTFSIGQKYRPWTVNDLKKEFRQASETVGLINATRKEAHLLGFHDCAGGPLAFDYKIQPQCSVEVVQDTSKLDRKCVERYSLK
ncbi:hypothetical protein TNCV_68401 [Trichonephila clavipes]|nr:hypothetical protein TNCV_68401 [Trichonephila clavipes]